MAGPRSQSISVSCHAPRALHGTVVWTRGDCHMAAAARTRPPPGSLHPRALHGITEAATTTKTASGGP